MVNPLQQAQSDTFAAMQSHLGKQPYNAAYDIDNDGKITLSDVGALQRKYQDLVNTKVAETNAILKPGEANRNFFQVTPEDIEADYDLTPQQLANNKVVSYWSSQSEPYSRVMSAINNGTAKFQQVEVGADEWNNPITQLALVDPNGPPGWRSQLLLNKTDQPNVYSFSAYNQVAAGNISGVLVGNPDTGFVAPVLNAATQFAYTPGSPGGVIRNIVSGITSGVNSLGPLGAIALAYATQGLSAELGAAMGLEGAAATIAGNTILQTTLNGGDVGKALTNSLITYAGASAGGLAAQFASDGELGAFLKANPSYAATIANTATRAALTGQSMEDAVKAATMSVGTDVALSKIDVFNKLDKPTQDAIRSSVSAQLQGKDVNLPGLLTNAAINGVTSYALNQNEDFKKLDPKLKSLLVTELSAGLQNKPLDQAAINWAMNQGAQAINKAVMFPNANAYAQYSGDIAAYTAAKNEEMALDKGFPDYKTYKEYDGDSNLYIAKQAGFPDFKTFQEFDGNYKLYEKNLIDQKNHQTILDTFHATLGRDPTPEEYVKFAGQNAINIQNNLERQKFDDALNIKVAAGDGFNLGQSGSTDKYGFSSEDKQSLAEILEIGAKFSDSGVTLLDDGTYSVYRPEGNGRGTTLRFSSDGTYLGTSPRLSVSMIENENGSESEPFGREANLIFKYVSPRINAYDAKQAETGSSTVTTPAGDISSAEGLRLKEVGSLLGLGTSSPDAVYRALLGGGARGGPDGNWSLISVDAPLREQVFNYLVTDLNDPKSDLTQEEKDKLQQVVDVIKDSLDQTKADITKTDVTKTDVTKTDVTKTDVTKTDSSGSSGSSSTSGGSQNNDSGTSSSGGSGSSSDSVSGGGSGGSSGSSSDAISGSGTASQTGSQTIPAWQAAYFPSEAKYIEFNGDINAYLASIAKTDGSSGSSGAVTSVSGTSISGAQSGTGSESATSGYSSVSGAQSGTDAQSGSSGYSSVSGAQSGTKSEPGYSGYSSISGADSGTKLDPGYSGYSSVSGAQSGTKSEPGYSGYSSISGESGYSGTSGNSGYSGTSGESGYSGRSGDSGYSGRFGESGYSGTSGESGYSGRSGDSGYSGTSGDSGYSGRSGDSGYSGTSGESGYSGTSGESGYSGRSGDSGYSGRSGDSGYSGTSGDSGYSGRSGWSGWSGNSGYSGTSGDSGWSGWSGGSGYSGTSGNSGYSGTSGNSGYSGLTGRAGLDATSTAFGAQFGSAGTGAVAGPTASELKPQFLTSKETPYRFISPLAAVLALSRGMDTGENQAPLSGNSMQTPHYSYGNVSSIDEILGLPDYFSALGGGSGSEAPMEAEVATGGLMSSPLMAATGGATGTRYGKYAAGGLPGNVVHHSGKARVDFRHGDAVTGAGDGQSDDIPAMLADGEFVFPADVVAAIGNGSTKAGSDKLYDMMHGIRAHVRSAKPKDLPPEIKSPLDFLGKKHRKA